MKSKSLAILMTCHNRRETTLRCLDTLEKQTGIDDIQIAVYLVDDGSTDGTSDAVAEKYPGINILQGDGTLYWGGGMHKAMSVAIKEGYDFYLWLNDDTVLYEDALKTLLKTYNELEEQGHQNPIIAGSLCDPENNKVSYGGYVRSSSWHPLRFRRLEPNKMPQKCGVLNGNLTLIHAKATEKIGNINQKLTHSRGDYEYCLRAAQKGIYSWIAPGYFGECSRNSLKGTWQDTSLPFITRYKKLLDKKGHPFYPRYIYISNYGGILWPILFVGVYIRPLLDQIKKFFRD